MTAPQVALSVRLPSTADAVTLAGALLRALLHARYGAEQPCHDVELAAVELVSNIVFHNPSCTALHLSCRCAADAVRVAITDNGSAFDMTAVSAALPADPLTEHGRGLWLVRQSVDGFRYARLGARNRHRFVRRTSRLDCSPTAGQRAEATPPPAVAAIGSSALKLSE